MRRVVVCVGAILLGAALALAGSIPVVNPGFETGNFSGWTRSGNPGFTGVISVGAHGGTYSAYFGPVGSLGFISQYVSTVPGEAYNVSFYLRGSDTPNRVELWWDGVLAVDWDNVDLGGWTLYGWSNLITNSSSTELRLGFRNDPSFLYLDDIAVEGAVIPEPSTLVLLGSGLALVLLRRRTKRRA